MGGTVAVSIRKSNGETIKMARKTGSYLSLLTSREFNNNQIDLAINDYIKIFFDMKKDFEDGEPYKYPMSPVYGNFDSLAPTGYGLVVIDLERKKIHSLQGYDNPGKLYPIEFSYSYTYNSKTSEDYDFLFRNNKLSIFNEEQSLGTVHDVLGNDITLDKMKNIVQESFGIKNKIVNFFKAKNYTLDIHRTTFRPLTLNDFETITYEESCEGLTQLAKNLVSDGFHFNNDEITQWIDFIENYLEHLELEDNYEWTDDEYDIKVQEIEDSYKKTLQDILFNKSPTPSRLEFKR